MFTAPTAPNPDKTTTQVKRGMDRKLNAALEATLPSCDPVSITQPARLSQLTRRPAV